MGGNIDLVTKLANCADELELWGRRIRMRFQGKINECKRNLEELRSNHVPSDINEFIAIKERLNVL